MFSARYFSLTTALLSLIVSPSAAFNINAKTNVAIYYGQGPNESQLGLKEFCANSKVEIIPLGFLDIYPAQGNGYPGTNFASSCTGTVFSGPGYNGVVDPSKNDLQNDCPTLVDGIGFCQAQGKKILLSLGGAPGSTPYQLTSIADANYLADFLWGAFGPLQPGNKWPRPFDDAATGSHSVDGFDFDIELIQPGEEQLYIMMINRLIGYFPTGPGAKKYLITGAPQCIVPDANMGDIITGVPFDILFVQYYNTPQCSARSWITANPGYPSVPETTSGFGFEFSQLLNFLKGGASKNAKIYFGLPGAPAAATSGDYLSIPEATKFLEAYFCQPSFGGVMIWEGIYAYDNIINGENYQNNIASVLSADSKNPTLKKCPATTPTYTTTSTTPTPTACVTCTTPYTIVSGDTCSALWTSHGIPSTTFYSLNPNINCGDLQIGQVICLGGSVGSCSSTTTTSTSPTATPCVSCTATHSVVSGDTCYSMWTAAGISSTLFYSLNPNIDCGDLQLGQIVCVEGSTYTCTTSTTSSTTTSTSPTATPCVSCTATHSVVSGDTCYSMWTAGGISSTLFYSLNPNIDCGDLQLGQVVCVGGSTYTCTTSTTSSTTSSTTTSTSPTATPCVSCTATHSVVSGDTCYSMWTAGGISSTLFYSLNPNINCGLLQLGQVICVGGSTYTCTTSSTTTTTSSSTTTTSSSSSSTSTTSSSSSSSTSSTSSSSSSSTSSTSSSSSTTTSTTSTTSSITSTTLTTSSSSSSLSTTSHTTNSTTSRSLPASGSSPSSHSHTSYGNSTSGGHHHHTSTPVTYTTTTTSIYTITSCPPSVTNCPIGRVTTDIRTITTTYCPASAASTPKITASPVKYTTSVVYTTLTYTITACPATVTNCPARGSVTTETKALYTTICPIAELTPPAAIPTSTAPGAPAKEVSVPVVPGSPVTSVNYSPAHTYSTVNAAKPSSTISSFAVVYQTVSVMPVASTSPSGGIVASASPVKPSTATFTGSAARASSFGFGGVVAIVLCVFGLVFV